MANPALIAQRNSLRAQYSTLKNALKRGQPPNQGVINAHKSPFAKPDIDAAHTVEDDILQQQIDWLNYKLHLRSRTYGSIAAVASIAFGEVPSITRVV